MRFKLPVEKLFPIAAQTKVSKVLAVCGDGFFCFISHRVRQFNKLTDDMPSGQNIMLMRVCRPHCGWLYFTHKLHFREGLQTKTKKPTYISVDPDKVLIRTCMKSVPHHMHSQLENYLTCIKERAVKNKIRISLSEDLTLDQLTRVTIANY